MKKWIGVLLLLPLLLSACTGAAEEQPDGLVKIYKIPT